LVEILQNKKNFKNSYEQKCFIIGITHILTVNDAPESIRDPSTVSRLLQEILAMLDKVQKKEAKEAIKKATKQIHAEENSDSDDSDYSDTSSEEEEETPTTHKENGKRSRGNSGAAEEMMDDEETKDDAGGLGFTADDAEAKMHVENKKKDTDSDEMSDSEDEYDSQFELAVTVDQLKSPMTKIDEFAMFSQAVNTVANQRPAEIGQILALMTKDQNNQLKELLMTKRINLQNDIGTSNANANVNVNANEPNSNPESLQAQAPRKVLRAKRRTAQWNEKNYVKFN